MLKKIATLAVAIGAVAGSGVMSDAEAHRNGARVYIGPRPYYGHRYYRPIVPVYPLVTTDCSYSRMMWRRTGRTYWKIRYYDCMGW